MLIHLEQLRESSFYQYILEEGRKEGRRIAREENLDEGRKEGEITIVRLMLEQRFGALPEWAAHRIEGADRPTLGNWGIRLLDAGSLEEVIEDDDSE
jgi:predicted transposase YdaD